MGHKNFWDKKNVGSEICRRPYQAKLTTIQHNFNPTIFWGGELYTLHLGLTLLVFLDKKTFGPILFDPKYFLTQKFLGPKKIFGQHCF